MNQSYFDKYDLCGAYHWIECDKKSPGNFYNPALEARYWVINKRILDGGRALDIGCGDGYLMGQISSRCEETVGIDAEKTAIDLANKILVTYKNCTAYQGSCYELQLLEGQFDTILMADVIEHLEAPELALKRITQIMKSTGTLYLTTPKLKPGQPLEKYHVQEFKSEQLKKLLQGFFEEVQLTYFWPTRWIRFYETKIGWRVVKRIAKYLYNPLAAEGDNPEQFDQILAVCQKPKVQA